MFPRQRQPITNRQQREIDAFVAMELIVERLPRARFSVL
jgi:hypothetical protein